MQICVLGPLLVLDDDGDEISIGAARQRVLLAALALRANELVPADALADVLWDGAPPAGARATLRSYVMRLRHALGPAADRIATRSPGYQMRVSDSELDVSCFESACRRAATAAGSRSWKQAGSSAADALALWRDTPLIDVPSDSLQATWVPHVAELRLQALEWHIEAELRPGRPEQMLPELRRLTDRHPFQERFHAQHMLALVHCGRRATALQVYQQVRRRFVAELGVEPGPQLQSLQQMILTQGSEPRV